MATQTRSLSSLLSRATIDDHEEVLSLCNAELKRNKGNSDVQHAKVVALLKLERYDEALHFIGTVGDGLREKAKLELAYALYKVGKLGEAAKLAQELETRPAKHVAAQALYRAEDFTEAAELYAQLGARHDSNEEQELRIHKGAIDAQLIWQGRGAKVQKKRLDRQDLEAYETAYNAACVSIARGDLGQADVLLKRAKGGLSPFSQTTVHRHSTEELCRHSQDLPEDEKATDLLTIVVQQLYILIKLGKVDEAKELSSAVNVEECVT